jgi:hypothetical protein
VVSEEATHTDTCIGSTEIAGRAKRIAKSDQLPCQNNAAEAEWQPTAVLPVPADQVPRLPPGDHLADGRLPAIGTRAIPSFVAHGSRVMALRARSTVSSTSASTAAVTGARSLLATGAIYGRGGTESLRRNDLGTSAG